MIETRAGRTEDLARYLAAVRAEDLPTEVLEQTKLLFLDWLASVLAGRSARPVAILEEFARLMGPAEGPSEVLTSRATSSPLFAAMVNAAASHSMEQDDVHNGAVFHPGTVVFPAVLAAAQQRGVSGAEFLTAAVVGYEVGVRVGQYLGRSHYRVFHTTGTAGTLAAAAAVAHVLDATVETMVHTLGSAGTQGAGLWEFLRDAADSKQLHAAKAASDGLLSAYIASRGFTGARQILEGRQGMAAGMSSDANPGALTDGLGRRWSVLETSLKWHASCRHAHPAADALLKVMEEHNLTAGEIVRVRAHVHQAALDVLGAVTEPRTLHQAKFSMGFVLALVAIRGHAAISDFTDDALHDPQLQAFQSKVEMALDPEVDSAYPQRWIGRVDVELVDGSVLSATVDAPKGDPENPLTRSEVEEKFRRLARFAGGASDDEAEHLLALGWHLDQEPTVGHLLVTR
jgi:2-methylcitrate dehydratase PrpD